MIDCKLLAKQKKEYLKEYISKNNLENKKLAIIQLSETNENSSYIKGKIKDCNEIGISYIHSKFNENSDSKDILELIYTLNENNDVNGIIIENPILEKFKYLTKFISKYKDIDDMNDKSLFIPPYCIINIFNFKLYKL